MNKPMSASVRTCPHVSPTEQDRTGQHRRGQETPLWTVDSSTHSLRQPFVTPSYENGPKEER